MVSTVNDNKVQFSAIVKWTISIFVSIVLSIGIAGIYFSSNKDISTKRDLLIATSTIGGFDIIAMVAVFKFIRRWNMKKRIFEIAKDA